LLLRVWNCSEGHNSFAVLHTCNQLTDEGERWDDRRETKGIEVACRCSQRVWRARARHYASLGNLANDSIEAAGMSSMWT